jgi:S-DNA-T family DNA segregation ATPase FtsK/SpoIIIE
LRRLHSGFITEKEINRIASYIKRMAEPKYDESVLAEPEETRAGVENGEKDENYWEAVRTVVNEGKCSITLIQRRLSLGYARAARIVDMMESEGVVGPGEGSKPREVLVGPEFLESLEAR